MKRFFFLSLYFIFLTYSFAQDMETINSKLLQHSDAVIRYEIVEIEVLSADKLRINTGRMVTVLNEEGESFIEAYDFYDDHSKIKKQSAVIYDSRGKEIKKFKKKDFQDRSAVGSGTLISDDRLKYMEYTARDYPYTVVYESEVEKRSTAFIRSWYPVSGYRVSVESSSYSLKNPAGIPLRFKEKNLDSLLVHRENSNLELNYRIENVPAYKKERLSPDFKTFAPQVLVALNRFSLAGVEGEAANWKEFGKWQYEHLLKDKTVLSPEIISRVQALTADAADDLEKARLIYGYVQENTRYISVQLGIGGWEPMSAREVDKVKYGDCKGLTNYTKALLESQGISSHYAVVYGGKSIEDIDPEFASMQGNHVILNIPAEEGDLWLECTSQTDPFNYLGGFTDNRNVLLVKPEGGEIVKTRAYSVEENLQESVSRIYLDTNGAFEAEVVRKSYGVPYGNIYPIARETSQNQELYYKNNWYHLKDLDFEQISFDNDRTRQVFTENLSFKGNRMTSRAGDRILLPLNFIYPYTFNLPLAGERNHPLEISRGRSFEDTFEFFLPAGYAPESIPEGYTLKSDFGNFELTVNLKKKEEVVYIEVKRTYWLNEGCWPAGAFEGFRKFMNRVNSYSNQKAVLVAI